ncbi:CBS domain-containing protein [uncultured Clostridium sp.]|uniref:CBS domain-containing protein n=1 Tax=uncultured Clostridium sp. TaxID=59620 RepID=UPI00262F3CEB|nr:CBS domain-containing protein [uncultured Clostridium sp.]
MNIAFFLTPKIEVVHEKENATMRRVLERMEHHSYTAIPLINEAGKYVGTLTEGDLLWKIKNTEGLDFKNTDKVRVHEIDRKVNHKSVTINSDMDSLISLATSQNFVPVVDDDGIFIGIIKRSDIIEYCYSKLNELRKVSLV